MRQSIQLAIDQVEHSRLEAEENETRAYWLTVKMENNRRGFREEEIHAVDQLYREFGDLIDHYDRMLKVARSLTHDMDEIADQTVDPQDGAMEEIQEQIRITSLYTKMSLLLSEGKEGLEKQNKLQSDAEALKQSLQKREGWTLWCHKLKQKFEGIFLGTQH
jgi:hypothetical protein